jgi:endonuclease YncB( thermonuclease family)
VSGVSWDCGAEATKELKEHLMGQKVECSTKYRDRFKRMVAKCTVNGEDIGAWLVRAGMALDFQRYSDGAYAVQQNEARSRKVGIWKGEFEMPWNWRKANRH